MPLIIDPSSQAVTWLRNYLIKQETTTEVIALQDPKVVSHLELAVR